MLRRHPMPGGSTRARPHVVFAVGGVTYAFDAAHARYVVRAGEAANPVHFLGRSYPVLDLRHAFGHPAPAGLVETGFILLVEGDVAAGLRVDELQGLRPIDAHELVPLPAVYRGPERRWIAGLATVDEAVIVVVRLPELLGTFAGLDLQGGMP